MSGSVHICVMLTGGGLNGECECTGDTNESQIFSVCVFHDMQCKNDARGCL